MATAADVNISTWTVQGSSPFYDGSYPFSVRPGGALQFFGYPETSVSSFTPSITVLSTPDMLPKTLLASASGSSGTGSRLQSAKAFKPYEHVYYKWTLTNGDDSSISQSEGITDPRDSSAKNPYIDQIGPEFSCVIREAGSYKLTLTAYYMTSTFGNVGSATTSTSFTVTAQTPNYQYFDGASGDNANDGNDPWGFTLSTASYTESTKELTQTGAFTSYNHSAATTGVSTGHYNVIYIDLLGFEGWYKIASKTSNDTIVLETGLGSDQSNVTSSDGPKLSYAGGNAVNDTIYCFSGNGGSSTQSYTVTSPMRQHLTGNANEVTTPSTTGYCGYNGTPRITSTGGVFNIGSNSGNTPPGSVWMYNLDVDADGNGDPVIGLQSTLTAATNQTFLFDNCTFRRSSTGTAINIQFTSTDLNDITWLFYKSVLDGREADTLRASNRHAIFSREDNDGWQRALACTFHTDSDSLVLDHFWYPTGSMNHFHCHWCDFAESVTGTSYCINTNNGITGTTAQYTSIVENAMGANAEWGFDASNATNDSSDKTFDNFVAIGNESKVTRGFTLHYALDGAFIAFNDISKNNTTDFSIWNQCATVDNTNYDIVAYGNRNYGGPLFNVDDGQHCEIINNENHRPTGATNVGQVDELDLGVGNDIVIDKNNLYAVDGATISVDASATTIASYNSTYSVTNTSTDPGWTDPANGNFDGSVNQGYTTTLV